jgi:uncharacterized repeat protein (TIGR04042 family)
MPEMFFTVRWPDQTVTDCYSPSTIIKQYFSVGQSYPLPEFVALSRDALMMASERVHSKYGYACTSALDQLFKIEHHAKKFSDVSDALVVVEKFGKHFS